MARRRVLEAYKQLGSWQRVACHYGHYSAPTYRRMGLGQPVGRSVVNQVLRRHGLAEVSQPCVLTPRPVPPQWVRDTAAWLRKREANRAQDYPAGPG